MHSRKFLNIPRDHRQVMHQRDRRDLQIIRADDTAPALQIVADDAIPIRTPIIERKRNHLAQCPRDNFLPHLHIYILFRPMHQFRAHRRAGSHLVNTSSGKPIHQTDALRLKNFYPNVTIEQVAHHHVFAGGSGNSGGSSNSTSAQHPIKSANSGIRRFISSSVGNTLSVSATEDKASRTCISSFSAASGFNRVSISSSSITTALMAKPSHFQLTLSSHKL